MPPIPRPQQVKAPGKHAALKDAQKEPRRQNPGIVLHQALQRRHRPEPNTAKSQPHPRRELLEQYIRRDLADDIRHEEDRQRRVVLHARHAQILLQPKRPGVGDVDAVEERHQVQHDHEGDDVQVDLGRDAPLGGVRRADHFC